MARITVEDCLKKVPSRFMLVNMVARRVRQIREGSEYLVNSPKNEDIVVSLREIAAGKLIVHLKNPPIVAAPRPAENQGLPRKVAEAAAGEGAEDATEADQSVQAPEAAEVETAPDVEDEAAVDAGASETGTEAAADAGETVVPKKGSAAVKKGAQPAPETDKETVS